MFSSLSISLSVYLFFFFNDTATTEIYTLSLHDALPILDFRLEVAPAGLDFPDMVPVRQQDVVCGVSFKDRSAVGGVHRRRVHQDAMVVDGEEQPIEVELLLLGEEGPLLDAGRDRLPEASSPRGNGALDFAGDLFQDAGVLREIENVLLADCQELALS